jgi:SPW repeat
MALKDHLKTHRTWQDGLGLLLGMTIGLAPWIVDERLQVESVLNAAISGLAILFVAQLELVRLRRWEEALELLLGLWVVISPFVFGYSGSGSLRIAHWTLGGLVAFIGGLELWQDWRKSREELDRYGS